MKFNVTENKFEFPNKLGSEKLHNLAAHKRNMCEHHTTALQFNTTHATIIVSNNVNSVKGKTRKSLE